MPAPIGLRRLRVAPQLVEGEQARAKLEALLDVVRDHEDGHAVVHPRLQDQFVHVGGDTRIERAEGFIEQQDLRLANHRLRDRQALLHAAGGCAG